MKRNLPLTKTTGVKNLFYKSRAFSFLILIACFQFSAMATIYPINNTFSGAQEVPANASPGTGTIVGTYNDVTNRISYFITFSGLLTNTVQGHFHAPAPPGVNASVVIGYTGFPVGVTSGSYSNSHVLTEAQETQLKSGLWYSNLHTTALPGGEIRAQVILGAASTSIFAINNTFSGAQEVPANASPGTGTIVGSYNSDNNTIFYTITFSGLVTNTVQGHFHAPAPPGVNASVVIGYAGFPVGVTSGTYSNSHVLTAAQETQLLSGLWYSNLHTTGLPGGEIRAQLTLQTLQATNPYTTCPNVNIAIIRAGTNADVTNPYFLYDVTPSTGTFAQVPGGPYKDPDNAGVNLQINAIGVNTADGFIYGLATQTTVTTNRLMRLDRTYGATSLGQLVSPSSPTGLLGIINSAAGDMDRSNNYWYTGFTANPSLSSPSGFVLDKLFMGRVANVSGLPVNGNPVPQYFEIDYSDANCAGYISTFNTDPNNSGLKDFCFNPFSNSFVAYVTYKFTGAATFTGQLVELKPIAGSFPLKYKMTCKPVINSHTAEVSGSLIANSGSFIILLTDGTVGRIGITNNEYNGVFTVLNASTGLPNPLRADMGSCGGIENSPLPVRLSAFTVQSKECMNTFNWKAENEISFDRYELEQSTDNNNFTTVSTVAGRRSALASVYKVTLPSASKQAYYRLKLIDRNGSYNYSYTLNVTNNCSKNFGFTIAPNPVLNRVNMNWYGLEKAPKVEITIFNANGSIVARAVKNMADGNSNSGIDVTGLQKGTYWVKAVDVKNNVSYQTNFIKQ